MTRKSRKPKRGGARPGAGRPPVTGTSRSVVRRIRLTPSEARAHDASCGHQPWAEWIRSAAIDAIRAQAVLDGCTATVLYCDVIAGRPLYDAALDHLQPEAAARISAMSPEDALREIGITR